MHYGKTQQQTWGSNTEMPLEQAAMLVFEISEQEFENGSRSDKQCTLSSQALVTVLTPLPCISMELAGDDFPRASASCVT